MLFLLFKDKVVKLNCRCIFDNEFCMFEVVYLFVKFFVDIEKWEDIFYMLYYFY